MFWSTSKKKKKPQKNDFVGTAIRQVHTNSDTYAQKKQCFLFKARHSQTVTDNRVEGVLFVVEEIFFVCLLAEDFLPQMNPFTFYLPAWKPELLSTQGSFYNFIPAFLLFIFRCVSQKTNYITIENWFQTKNSYHLLMFY